MSSDEDVLMLAVLLRRKNKKKRKYWVHPYNLINRNRSIISSCTSEQMINDPEKFRSFYRMSQNAFKHLLDKIGPCIQKLNTKFRASVLPEEKLIITLR